MTRLLPTPNNRIDWTQLYFHCAASGEPFEDVVICAATDDKEYVSIPPDGTQIKIYIKGENMEDPDVLYRALDMLADALNVLDNESGAVQFMQ